jgi:hypothetical protein
MSMTSPVTPTNPIFGARLPIELRDRLERHMTEAGLSKSALLIEALGQYVDVLDGKSPLVAQPESSPLEHRFAVMEERMAILEDLLLEEFESVPQPEPSRPRYERRLRPVS